MLSCAIAGPSEVGLYGDGDRAWAVRLSPMQDNLDEC
jgi:hypothetical protein